MERQSRSCQYWRVSPLKPVNALQSVTPAAMTARRDFKSLKIPSGTAVRENTTMYADPSQPSCVSLSSSSRLIGSNRAKTMLRSMKLMALTQVSRPRTYQVYAPGVADVRESDTRQGRGRSALVAEPARAPIGFQQSLVELRPALVQPLEPARLPARQRVRREQGQPDGAIHVTDHRVGQLRGVHLAPTHRLARRGTRQAAGVRPSVR